MHVTVEHVVLGESAKIKDISSAGQMFLTDNKKVPRQNTGLWPIDGAADHRKETLIYL